MTQKRPPRGQEQQMNPKLRGIGPLGSIATPTSSPATTSSTDKSCNTPAVTAPGTIAAYLAPRAEGSMPTDYGPRPTTPWDVSPNEAGTCFTIFRDQMLRFFPFMNIPPDLGVQRLREEKPLLFRAILTVTSKSSQQKRSRGLELKRLLAQSTIVETRYSIDISQCLLAFICWGHDQFLNMVPSSIRLTQLAMSLVYDLRLDRPLAQGAHHMPDEVHGHQDSRKDPTESTNPLPLEQERAVLACFLLSSVYVSLILTYRKPIIR